MYLHILLNREKTPELKITLNLLDKTYQNLDLKNKKKKKLTLKINILEDLYYELRLD